MRRRRKNSKLATLLVLALGVINIDKIVDASGAKEKDNDYTISLINNSALTPR